MTLDDTYQKIKPAIVAFVPKFFESYGEKETLPEFPPIFGTGFIVADGLVVTNDHVVRAISRLPRPNDCPKEIWPVTCLLLHFIPGKGIAEIPIEVIGVFQIGQFEAGKNYYGPPKPDIAIVHIKMKDLPLVKVKYRSEIIREGREIATAGFPMGTNTLMAPGYLHQLTPTLQKGIISAVLPFQCDTPHALMINVMTQGGASGSPVFLPESEEVIGVLYGGLNDLKKTIVVPQQGQDPSVHAHFYQLPTNASYVVPSSYIEKALERIVSDERFTLSQDTPSLTEILNSAQLVERKRGQRRDYQIWTKENTPSQINVKEIEPGGNKE